jgi:PLP dependent protein
MISYEQFLANLAEVRGRVTTACLAAGRHPDSVRLLPVTKTHPATAALYAARAGLAAVGENRVQEAATKRLETAAACAAAGMPAPRWELIGHLQSNKARAAAETFECIQSVDTEKLVRRLDAAVAELGPATPLTILLQVNAGADPAKFGCEPADAPHLLDVALGCPRLHVAGLMAIAPLGTTPREQAEHARRTFTALRAQRDTLATTRGTALPELSMGMSGDLDLAIAAGATCIRVGSALYGAR